MALIELQLKDTPNVRDLISLERAYKHNILLISSNIVDFPFALWNKVLRIIDENDIEQRNALTLSKAPITSYTGKNRYFHTLIKPNGLSYSDIARHIIFSREKITNIEMINMLIAGADPVREIGYIHGRININQSLSLIGIVNQYEWESNPNKNPLYMNITNVKNQAYVRDVIAPTIQIQYNSDNVFEFIVDYSKTEYVREYVQIFITVTQKWESPLYNSEGNITTYRTNPLRYNQEYILRVLYFLDDWRYEYIRFTPFKSSTDYSIEDVDTGISVVDMSRYDDLLFEWVYPMITEEINSNRIYYSEGSKIEKSVNGKYHFIYNDRNNIIKVMNANLQTIFEYYYDIDDNLVDFSYYFVPEEEN